MEIGSILMSNKSLIVGCEGLLGAALMAILDSAIGTSRRLNEHFHLDLSKPIPELPECNVVYLTAAIKGFEPCEGKPLTWRVNADAPIAIALQLKDTAFPVFISTDAVEWSAAAYSRQKAYVEPVILMLGGAVIRPGRFDKSNVEGLAKFTENIGRNRLSGVHKWP